MRGVVLLSFILWGMTSFAADREPDGRFNNVVTNQSRFHLLDTRCQRESSDNMEATPQSPPLEVDDPGTPGCNRWEVNVLLVGDLTDTDKNWEVPLLDINYGIGSNLQLKYEVPFVNNNAIDTSAAGVGNSKVGLKAGFYKNEEADLEMAVYPQVEFVTPNSGAVENGIASSGNVVTLPFLISKKIGETPGHGEVMAVANLGYNISSKPKTTDFISASLGLGLPLLRRLALMGGVSTEQAIAPVGDEAREEIVRGNIGFLGAAAKWLQVYGSLGQSIYASDSKNHSYVLAGIRLLTEGSAQ